MTIRVRELAIQTGSVEGDPSGRRRRIRQFHVLDVIPSAIPTVPGATPIVDAVDGTVLPLPLDTHPDDPEIRADSVQASPLGNAHDSRVTVTYSNDGSGRFARRVEPEDQAFRRRIPGLVEVQVNIPVQFRTKRFVGDSTTEVDYWEPVPFPVIEYRVTAGVRVSVPDLSLVELRTIASQVGKVHTIGGERLLMKPPRFSDTGDRLEIYYEWEIDDGTPDDFLTGYDARVATPIDTVIRPLPGPDLIRDPYNRLTLGTNLDPAMFPQDTYQIRLYPESVSGWTALPGSPGELLQ